MQTEEFDSIIRNQAEKAVDLLLSKNDAYNPNEDRLHNFKVAAELQGVSTREALAGMMVKHTVSVYDLCRGELNFDSSLWDEKINDHINYLLLLKAVVVEESKDVMNAMGIGEDSQ